MKLKLILIVTILFSNMKAQVNTTETQIKTTIINFVMAADQQDDIALASLLDDDFRLALNQMFGNAGLVLIDKKTYLAKIKAKEFGGDQRKVEFESVFIHNNTSTVIAKFTGQKMTILTALQLIKSNDGIWKLLNDLPNLL